MTKQIKKIEKKVEGQEIQSVQDIATMAMASIRNLSVNNSVIQNTILLTQANTCLWCLKKKPHVPSPAVLIDTELDNVQKAMEKILKTSNGNG
jgi:hypothetical protein